MEYKLYYFIKKLHFYSALIYGYTKILSFLLSKSIIITDIT